MSAYATDKQFAIRLSGSDVIPGIHFLNIFGTIARMPADSPSIRRFDSREEAEQWIEKYKARPYCAFSAFVIEL